MYLFKKERDPHSGRITSYYWDDVSKTMRIREETDVTDIIEGNKRQQANSVDGRYGGEMMHHVAEIPNAIAFKWLREDGLNIFSKDPEMKRRLRMKLDDPAWRYLKSTNKRLWRPA